MRVTLPHPSLRGRHLDVDVAPGLPAGDLRRRLAVLTGDARWARPGARLTVSGQVLDDDHPAGAAPLLPGAHLAADPAPHADVEATARCDVHVAVLTGPGAGRLVPLADGARVRVPVTHDAAPGTTDRDGSARVRQTDPVTAHIEVRRRGARVTVRARGTGVPARLRPAPGRAGQSRRERTLRRRPRTWPAHAALRVRGTTLQLRGCDGAHRRPRVPPWAAAGAPVAVSVALAVALAVALRQPLLLLTAVTGVVGLVALRGGRAPEPGPPPADAPDGTDGRQLPGPSAGDAVTPGGPAGRSPSGAGRRGTDPPEAPPGPGGPPDVAALRLATWRRLLDLAGAVPGATGPWPPDGTLAVTGARDAALGVARALALRTLGAGTPTRLVVRTGTPDDWRWTRWWDPDHALPPPEEADVLVVADGADAALGAWRLGTPHARLLLVVPPGSRVPAWARWVVPAGHGSTLDAATGGPPECVDPHVADAQGRAAAALAWVLRAVGANGGGTAHASVLGDLPGVPAPAAPAVADAWAAPGRRGLATPVGSGRGGHPVVLDLVRDGPHVLVAGTTGAGKSELLTTAVLGLALTHPPRRLALLLVDFKGGTGLGPLAGLPHVVDHVHDLDVAAARRTLAGLRAELRRRERLLAAAGCTDVADLDPASPTTPARLLVVVDELRALVDDLPDAAATLARLAAQGRALGVHLVLATQRPAGAVPADLRANVTLRLAMRVADEEDSRDVLGCPDAAHLDPAAPGGALLRSGSGPVVSVQVARARYRRNAPPVRLLASVPVPGAVAWRAPAVADDDVAAWVAACRDAARDLAGPGVPWQPALPDRVAADDVAPAADGTALLVAVADLPDEQRRAPLRWGDAHGHLLVLGGPRSGRTTTLCTVGLHALLGGAHVHAVGLPDAAVAALRARADHLVGTTAALDDVHRTLLLIERLSTTARPAGAPAVVLLVDGLDDLLERLAEHARGRGADLLAGLLRRPPAGVRVAASGPVVPASTRWAGGCGLRLVLPVADTALDAQAGVPVELAGPRRVAGRAVACSTEGAWTCQVVLPSDAPAPQRPRARGASEPAPGHQPLRIGALPERSTPPLTTTRAPAPGILLGVGGDGPHPVTVDPGRPLVVAGPPGSGRSTALATLARGWLEAGRRVLVVTADELPGLPEDAVAVAPAVALAHLDDTGARTSDGTLRQAPGGSVVLADDVDLLERTAPSLAARLEQLLDEPPGAVVVGALTTTTAHAATGYRGPVTSALRGRQVLVLDAYGPAAAELLGPGAAVHSDPRARPPGRGVLRRDRALVRVQVHAPVDGASRSAA
ncbi:FtsK/SpoIIIE domain-containing protein [Cellulomonas flavigena]|uniref:FtsK/SpoIIIE domain-containing protein n=1 Tax=Cellulomonas flavigena TaxID=1711 RepID=UPI0005BA484B|nr:FtsK/SpoIIIE domain-containing protein [Cellulomonas flavigena]